jgi:hypothetical protein
MAKARDAAGAVRATEAARDGWLGDQADLDFSADLTLISESLLQARRIEKVVQRSKKIPDPSPDDVAMLRDAEKTVTTLRTEAKSRVGIIEDCVKHAREIDRLLAEDRRRQEVDRQREAARRELAAELYGAEMRSPAQRSYTADAIAACVQAFRDLKNIVDEQVLREIEGGGANPVYGLFVQVRRVLSFAGVPTILEDMWLPGAAFKGLSSERLAGWRGATYAMFELEFGVRMVRAQERLRAVAADAQQAQLLRVHKGHPLLSVERIALTYNDVPMEFRRGLYRTDSRYYRNDLS